MKVWKRVKFLKKDETIDRLSRAYINYIYRDGPIQNIIRKYHIDSKDIITLNQYTANRIAGLLVLYFAKDQKRLHDIALKYHSDHVLVGEIIPELEGYIEK